MNAIVSYILQATPELLLALIFGIVAWKLSKRLTATDAHFKNADESIASLKRDVQSMKATVVDIQLFITSKFPTAINTFASKNSPLALNENGKKLFADCGGDKFLSANQVILLEKIQEKNPKTALDVETYSREVLLSMINNDIFNPLKVWIYNSPALQVDGKDYTVTLGDICFVLSLPLRDKYLSLHPEIAG